ncbi:MAG: hypothetical protein ACRCSP_04685 [Rhodoglobus sp.]
MDVATGIVIAMVTVVVVVGGAVLAGFIMLFRRRGDHGILSHRSDSQSSERGTPSPGAGALNSGPEPIAQLSARAGSLLVRLDDTIRRANEELGFAVAQFGSEKTETYRLALARSRAAVAEAFHLRHALDDSEPDSDRKRREWTLQIIALCEQAQGILSEQDAAFARLRGLEASAADTLSGLRSTAEAMTIRLAESRETLAQLAAQYTSATLKTAAHNPAEAEKLLNEAKIAMDAAAPEISKSGVNAISGTLHQAARAVSRAEQLLAAVHHTEGELHGATQALELLRSSARSELDQAKRHRDSAPDAPTGRAIIEAMTSLDSALVPAPGLENPVAEVDRINAAMTSLDLAVAGARNQSERLDHARAAYAGTLVSVASQIEIVREYVAQRGGGVEARTRLAEAERQYALAQAEIEPVEALDIIRRAATLARDAEALAHYAGR